MKSLLTLRRVILIILSLHVGCRLPLWINIKVIRCRCKFRAPCIPLMSNSSDLAHYYAVFIRSCCYLRVIINSSSSTVRIINDSSSVRLTSVLIVLCDAMTIILTDCNSFLIIVVKKACSSVMSDKPTSCHHI